MEDEPRSLLLKGITGICKLVKVHHVRHKLLIKNKVSSIYSDFVVASLETSAVQSSEKRSLKSVLD